jgi:Ca2+/Na+ antiporter
MGEIVRLRFKYTEEEWVAASRLYIMGQPTLLLRFGAAFLLLAVCVLFFTLISEVVMSLFLLSVALVLFTFVLALFFVLPRQRFRSDPRFQDEFSMEFTDEAIRFQTPHIDSKLSWSLYTRVLENERFFVLLYGKGMITVIPKRAFTAHHQETALREMLGRKLGHTADARKLKELPSHERASAYIPPAEPPDWR